MKEYFTVEHCRGGQTNTYAVVKTEEHTSNSEVKFERTPVLYFCRPHGCCSALEVWRFTYHPSELVDKALQALDQFHKDAISRGATIPNSLIATCMSSNWSTWKDVFKKNGWTFQELGQGAYGSHKVVLISKAYTNNYNNKQGFVSQFTVNNAWGDKETPKEYLDIVRQKATDLLKVDTKNMLYQYWGNPAPSHLTPSFSTKNKSNAA